MRLYLVIHMKLFILIILSLPFAKAMALSFIDNQEVNDFALQMEREHSLAREEVLASLHQAQPKPEVLQIIQRAPEANVDWLEYKARFIDEQHIRDGRKFIRQHIGLLNQIEQLYRVPKEVVVAIIGVETNYGRLDGGYRAIDALATLAFSDYRRNLFFRAQLEELFLLAIEQDKNPLSYRSSYAGAIGLGQFLPSSYRTYGVDFDNDNEVSLHQSPADSVASIANYLSAHGWCPNLPIAVAAKREANSEPLADGGFLLQQTLAELRDDYGVSPLIAGNALNQEKALVISLAGEEPPLWLGFCNYYVLSRYNPSHYYVMALFFLSQEIANLSEESL